MVNFFYAFQTFMLEKHPKFLAKISYRIIFFILRILIPIYYKITRNIDSCGIRTNNEKILVSMTSFPQRIDKVWIVLESLMRQSFQPDKIILWLAESQFKSKEDLPESILRYEKKGLEIKFVEDLKSHKKYFYAIRDYPEYHLITVDDDLFYPENLVKDLYQKHLENPNAIICNRVHLMTFSKESLNSYNDWNLVYQGDEGPNSLFFPTTGGGTLFPSGSLSPHVLDKDVFMDICRTADDVWLKCMSYLNGTEIRKVQPFFCEIFSVFKPEDGGLQEINVANKKNDIQLLNVLKFYDIEISKH